MTVEEYDTKIHELLKNSNGSVPGIKLSKDCNIKINVAKINNNPTIVLSETDSELNPTKIVYCMELSDMQTARTLQIWVSEATGILAHNEIQKADISDLNK